MKSREIKEIFKGKAGLIQLFEILHTNYRINNGIFGTTIGLSRFNNYQEIREVGEFLGLSEYDLSKKRTFKIADIFTEWEKNRYGQLLTIEQAIEAIVGNLVTKQEIFLEKKNEERILMENIFTYLGSIGRYFSKENQASLLKIKNTIGEEKFSVSLACVKKVFANLPIEPTVIPFYANKWFHNPHILDEKEIVGSIVYMLFRNFFEMIEEKSVEMPEWLSAAEYKNELLANFNFIRDNVSRIAMISGLSAIDTNGKVVQSFIEQTKIGIPWAVTVKQLFMLESISPVDLGEVLVIENNAVFDVLTSIFPQFPIVLTSGQFNYANWLLLEKVVCGGNKIVYTSDLDTAGLGMAQNLLNRFPEKVVLLGMDVDSYQKIEKGEKLTDISTLKCIDHPELILLRDTMLQQELKGFQEGLLDFYIRWIKKRIH
ncbi:TIGR02679 domain-containing protein [Enterococcus sp. AZ192]|uniref:TIGR02679 domain-containing protein n=1 Tax=unclassified Enterococcus TaxID=2608891 RepID=UPI003D2CBAD0